MAYDNRILNFMAYRDAWREGGGKGEKREKSAYHMTSNMSRCREWAVFVQRHIDVLTMWRQIWGGMDNNFLTAAYYVYVFTDCSTSVHGTLPHKLLETIQSVSPLISTNWLLSWWCPHGTTKTLSLVHHATSLFQYVINSFSVRGRNLARTVKQLPWIANFIVSYWN